MRHISILLGEKIIQLFDDSGASEIEKLAALAVAKAIVPVSPNSASERLKVLVEGKGSPEDPSVTS